MQFTIAHDMAVHYRLSGRQDGPCLVFINSLGTDLRIWDDMVDGLRADYRCLCYDKRGHGLSDGDDAAYSISLLADDLAALIETLGISSKVVLVGLSVGGLIAQDFAFRFAEKVAGLVLLDTAAKIGTEQSWNARIDAIAKNGLSAIGQQIMERWLTADFKARRPDAYRGYRNMLERTSEQAYVATCIALRDADLTSQTSTLALPTLVIVGQEDASTPPELVEKTANLINHARFVQIGSCGHLPCIEQPQATIEHLKTFVSETVYG